MRREGLVLAHSFSTFPVHHSREVLASGAAGAAVVAGCYTEGSPIYYHLIDHTSSSSPKQHHQLGTKCSGAYEGHLKAERALAFADLAHRLTIPE